MWRMAVAHHNIVGDFDRVCELAGLEETRPAMALGLPTTACRRRRFTRGAAFSRATGVHMVEIAADIVDSRVRSA